MKWDDGTGDRSFSRWKGSVVDSVVGVFLTQNVSDVLSRYVSSVVCPSGILVGANNHESAALG